MSSSIQISMAIREQAQGVMGPSTTPYVKFQIPKAIIAFSWAGESSDIRNPSTSYAAGGWVYAKFMPVEHRSHRWHSFEEDHGKQE